MKRRLAPLACAAAIAAPLFLGVDAHATVFGGVDFPGGVASFADAVVDYSPAIKSGQPTAPYRVAGNALGAPDPSGGVYYVSLGDGGSLTLRFTDNSLTGSDSTANDLWIFEIGPDVEDTFVDVSTNGIDWLSVGKVTGSTRGIDIDAYGYHSDSRFSFVRLIDDTNEGDQSGATVGADIDAVGAISTAPPVPTPAPDALWLMGLAIGGLSLAHLRARSAQR